MSIGSCASPFVKKCDAKSVDDGVWVWKLVMPSVSSFQLIAFYISLASLLPITFDHFFVIFPKWCYLFSFRTKALAACHSSVPAVLDINRDNASSYLSNRCLKGNSILSADMSSQLRFFQLYNSLQFCTMLSTVNVYSYPIHFESVRCQLLQ